VTVLRYTKDLPDTVAIELVVPALVQEIASVLWKFSVAIEIMWLIVNLYASTLPTMNAKSFRINTSTAENLERDTYVSFAPAHAHRVITSLIDIEWARIAPDKVVVATADRAWLHRLGSAESDAPFARPMVGAGSVATTRKLLDGAMAAAKCAVSSSVRPPTLTRTQWVWSLAGSYHLTHSYPPLIEEAAWRFEKMGRKNLWQWAAQKAREERGHDRLALLDIQSMGYEAEAVVEELIPPVSVVLVNYLTQSVQAPDPIGCVGYSYTMERLATGIKEKHIQPVEALLPPGICATRCLRVHSSVGADVEHVKETVEMVAGLDPQERVRVAIACYETALLCFSPLKEDYISEEELQHVLKLLKSRTCLQARVDIHSLTQ
jgi:hypothetical protein